MSLYSHHETRLTEFGFVWGPVEVERVMEARGSRIIGISTQKRRLQVYISPSGRSVRVFEAGKELKPEEDS